MNKQNLFPYLLLFIQPIFMASNLIIARGAVNIVPPISLAFWRWIFCFLLLLPFTIKLIPSNFKFIKKEFLNLIILGTLSCGVCGAFPFIAGKTTTVVNMGIIYSSSPIFIIMISVIIFKEKINIFRVCGTFLCLFGVLTVIAKGNILNLLNIKFNLGDFWMLGASIGWAIYSIYLFYKKSNLNILLRFNLISLFGALSLLPFYIIENSFHSKTIFNIDFFSWVLFSAISPSIIAFLLYNFVQSKLGASITGSVLYLYTTYGAFYGLVFFDEVVEIYHIYSTLFVFLGIYLVQKKISE